MDGERLQLELSRLLQTRFRARAERKEVKRSARLRCEGYDEVVLIRDISASGVRMLVAPTPAFDLARTVDMTLLVKVDDEVREIPVTVVRVVTTTAQGVELACRFLNPEEENAEIAGHLRSLFFAR